MRICTRVAFAAALIAAIVGGAHAAPTFTITEIAPVGVGPSAAAGVNNAGQVAFYGPDAYGSTHGFLWDNGAVTDMGSLGGGYSVAVALNDSAQAAGYYYLYAPTYAFRAFRWDDGVMTEIGTLGGNSGYGFAINNNGDVAGFSQTLSGSTHGFLWADGALLDLGAFAGGTTSDARGVNDLRQVVGGADTASGYYQAFLWEDGVMQGLPGIGGTYSEAFDINESGIVVGTAYDASGYSHACLWEDGLSNDMGTLPGAYFSYAEAINDAGWTVGYGDIPGGGNGHAVLWAGGGIYDLNDLIPSGTGWELNEAKAISNRGYIVGEGFLNGQYRGFLLTPNAAVPAPGALVLGMLGVGAVSLTRKLGERRGA